MHRSAFLLACVAVLTSPVSAQQMDMQAMQRWGSAKVIYYAAADCCPAMKASRSALI